jgi:hypothetical protein
VSSSPIFGQLETSLSDYLTDITYRAQFGDERAAAMVARYELPRLVEALKAVLDEHSPDAHGRCPTCRTRRFGRAPAPCRAYLTAHLCLVVTEEGTPEETTLPMRRQVAFGQ